MPLAGPGEGHGLSKSLASQWQLTALSARGTIMMLLDSVMVITGHSDSEKGLSAGELSHDRLLRANNSSHVDQWDPSCPNRFRRPGAVPVTQAAESAGPDQSRLVFLKTCSAGLFINCRKTVLFIDCRSQAS